MPPLRIVFFHPKLLLKNVLNDLLGTLICHFLVWHIVQWVTISLEWFARPLNLWQLELGRAATLINVVVESFRECYLHCIDNKIE